MSAIHKAKMVKAKAKAKAKREKLKSEALQRWQTCCRDNLEPWDCYCSRGCTACDVTHQCTACTRLYRPHEIIALEQPLS